MFKMKLFCSLIFFIFSLALTTSEEPQCSKFHYEAQTLEKMIRMEVKVEVMEKEILKTNQLVLESLQALTNEKENLANDYAVAKKSILDENEKLEKNYLEQERGILDEKEKLKQSFADLKDTLLADTKVIKDGGWSAWNSWSSCSLTCGGGIKSRSRSCTNPRPSALGRQCEGDAMQDISCNFITCSVPATTIMFRARDLVNLSSTVVRTLIFKTITINYGNGYDNNTGVFTAPIAGTYSFTTQLCVNIAENFAHCSIEQNGVPLISSNFQGGYNAPCSNAVVYAALKANDTVSVKLITGNGHFYEDTSYRWSTFSGVLLGS